ncbi:MAG: DUF2059 domain-containing protein [Pseudolabrys sp.]|nr:DUF2059 domain-containing protein [Pseudolabrys sp.]
MLALVFSAHAQNRPSAAAIETAREILALKGGIDMFATLIPSVIEQNKGILVQQNPMLQKDANEVAEQLRTSYASRNAEVIREVATLYASHFTEEELKQLLVFYKSPLGKKVVTEEPKAAEQSMGFAQTWAVKFSDEVLTKLRDELKKKGHQL